MQMIAEIYGILRDGLGMRPKEIGGVFAEWNKGRLNSYLIEITAKVLAAGRSRRLACPMVDVILDRAGQKGTGKWSVIEAQTLGVAAPAIEAAVDARILSAMRDERVAAEKGLWPAEPRGVQGRSATPSSPISNWRSSPARSPPMRRASPSWTSASKEFGWNLPMATVARIWRAGCIIRSQFLGTIAEAFSARTARSPTS